MGPDMAAGFGGLDDESYKENLSNILMCPECKEDPPNLIEEFSSGDMVCGSCGVVLGDRIIDSRSEWRTFSNDDQNGDDPSRVGQVASSLAEDEGLRTTIDTRVLSNKYTGKLSSISKRANANDKGNNELQEGYRLINTYVDRMEAGHLVASTSSHIFKAAQEHGQLKGKSRDAVIAGCLFIACRQLKVARTFREIHSVTSVSKKEIGRSFKSLEAFLMKIGERDNLANAAHIQNGYQSTSSTSAEDLCTRYCGQLHFRNATKVENVAKKLAHETLEIADLAGRSPLSVASACIFFASHYVGEPKASKDIAKVAGVSDGTIKTAYKYLWVKRKYLEDKIGGGGDLDKLPSS